MAKELGADFQLQVKRENGPQQLAKSVEDLLGAQPHVTIECTGVESSVQTAIYVCIVTFSIFDRSAGFDWYSVETWSAQVCVGW